MRTRVSCAIALGVCGVSSFGCHEKSASITVCFNPPSSRAEAVALSQTQTQGHLAAAGLNATRLNATRLNDEGDWEGEDREGRGFVEDLAPLSTASTSFLLWGDSFARQEVRDLSLDLEPGDYAFLCRFAKPDDDVQGTLRVHRPDDELWQTMQKWRAELPQQRRRLAFGFELQKRQDRVDTGLLDALQSQLVALDRFERQLERMADREVSRNDPGNASLRHLAAQNMISIFEREGVTGRAASLAAFSLSDVNRVRSAEEVCRLLVIADQDEIAWKKQTLGQLIRDTVLLRASARDEIARLEGRKKLRAIVFRDHESFMQNEESLRGAKGEFGRITQRLKELRLHVLALAVREELVVRGSGDLTAEQQARELEAEIRITETALERSELLFSQSVETNPGRVGLRASLEGHHAELQNLQNQLDVIEDVRVAIRLLQAEDTPKTRIAPRRVLASANITPALLQDVFRLLENDALITVRLESRSPKRRPSSDQIAQRSGEFSAKAVLANN